MDKKLIKKIIIGVVVIIALFLLYLFFFGNSSSQNTPANGSLLISSDTSSSTPASGVDSQISSDTSFISTLLGLNTITIDPSIFSNSAYTLLKDNTVPIVGTGIVGRVNPFAPFDATTPADTSTSIPTIVPTATPATAPATTGSNVKKP